jgi:hypothetical protein
MERYVALHPQVIESVRPLLVEKDDDEAVFHYGSFWMWVKRRKIPMSRFRGTSCSVIYESFASNIAIR